jgi:hypothetical protein
MDELLNTGYEYNSSNPSDAAEEDMRTDREADTIKKNASSS